MKESPLKTMEMNGDGVGGKRMTTRKISTISLNHYFLSGETHKNLKT
jgi:hypothetical protein